jgi:hypothetical protein
MIAVSVVIYNDPPLTFYYNAGWLILVGLLLWLGNMGITKLFDRYFPWLKYGKKRFFTHLAIGIFYSVNIINIAYLIFKIVFTEEPPTTEQIIVTNVYGTVLFVPFFSIYFSLYFLNSWQETELEMEKFQKESMRTQLATLKNHLDPHFLFNNLNILSSLIDKNRDMSQEFLVRFAQVYRTMLLTKVEDLISLEDEMDFIKSYIFLIRPRFEENIQFDINIDEEAYFSMLPPLTIQLLIENAVKHNIITEERPLKISINASTTRLEITNTLYEKPAELISKSGTGIKNIKERYRYFTDEELIFEKNKTNYRVSLPLMEIETI